MNDNNFDLPTIALPCPGSCPRNCDDSYTIIVNNNLSDASKKDAIRHEVCHIMGNDFFKEDIDSIETSCHQHSVDCEVGEDLDFYIK